MREGCHYNSNHPKQETQCHLVLHGQWSPDLPSQSNKLDLDLPSLLMITNRVSTTHHIPFTENNIVNQFQNTNRISNNANAQGFQGLNNANGQGQNNANGNGRQVIVVIPGKGQGNQAQNQNGFNAFNGQRFGNQNNVNSFGNQGQNKVNNNGFSNTANGQGFGNVNNGNGFGNQGKNLNQFSNSGNNQGFPNQNNNNDFNGQDFSGSGNGQAGVEVELEFNNGFGLTFPAVPGNTQANFGFTNLRNSNQNGFNGFNDCPPKAEE